MKRELNLNIISQSPFSLRNVNALNMTLVLLAIILLVFLRVDFVKQHAALTTTLQELATRANQQKTIVKKTPVITFSNEALRLYQTIWQATQLPWDDLLDALETAQQNDVYLMQASPDAPAQRVTLQGKATDLKAVLLYIDALAQSKVLTDVFLQQHEVNNALSATPVDFTIIAKWHHE